MLVRSEREVERKCNDADVQSLGRAAMSSLAFQWSGDQRERMLKGNAADADAPSSMFGLLNQLWFAIRSRRLERDSERKSS